MQPRIATTIAAMLALLSLLPPHARAQQDPDISQQQAREHWLNILNTHQRIKDLPGLTNDGALRLNREQEAAELDALVRFMHDGYDDMAAHLDSLGQRFGGVAPTPIARGLRAPFGPELQAPDTAPQGIPSEPRLGRALAMTLQAKRWMPRVIQNSADINIRDLSRAIDNLSFRSEDIIPDELDRLDAWADALQRFAPNREETAELKQQLAHARDHYTEAIRRAIAARKLPDNMRSFEGPGKQQDLIDAARKLLSSTEAWTKNGQEILAIRHTSSWFIAERNILEQPIRYGTQFAVAVTTPERKANGIARLYHIALLTERAAGVEQAPPFRSYHVIMALDNPASMLIENIESNAQEQHKATPDNNRQNKNQPANGDAPANNHAQDAQQQPGNAASADAPPGLLSRSASLLLAAANLIAAATLLAPLIAGLAPATAKPLATLTTNSTAIAAATAAAAGLALLNTTLRASPTAALLPIAAASAAAWLLFNTLQSDHSTHSTTPGTNPAPATDHNTPRPTAPLDVPVGIACAATALLHLLAGHLPLL